MNKTIAALMICAVLLFCSGCATVAETPAMMIGSADFDQMITVTVTPVEDTVAEDLTVAALAR